MTRLDAVAPAQEGGGNGGLPSPVEPQADEISDAAAETASEPVAVSPAEEPVDTDALKAELKKANEELKQIQGDDPLMQPVVNGQTVAEVISGWTGIPIGKMVADEINAVLNLAVRCASEFLVRIMLSMQFLNVSELPVPV